MEGIDSLIREFLVFRGCPKSYETFTKEKEVFSGFNVDSVAEKIIAEVKNSLQLSFWIFLKEQFFSEVPRSATFVKEQDFALKKHGIAHALQSGQREIVTEFLKVHGDELSSDPDWGPWFSLPFRTLSSAADSPHFADFFAPNALKDFAVTLKEFLATMFRQVPLPRLLLTNSVASLLDASQARVLALESEVERLRDELSTAQLHISRLLRSVAGSNRNLERETEQVAQGIRVSPPPPQKPQKAKAKLTAKPQPPVANKELFESDPEEELFAAPVEKVAGIRSDGKLWDTPLEESPKDSRFSAKRRASSVHRQLSSIDASCTPLDGATDSEWQIVWSTVFQKDKSASPVNIVRIDPSGALMASASSKKLVFADVEHGHSKSEEELVCRSTWEYPSTTTPTCLDWTPKARSPVCLFGAEDGVVSMYKILDKDVVGTLSFKHLTNKGWNQSVTPYVESIATEPSGTIAASFSWVEGFSAIGLWSSATGQVTCQFEIPSELGPMTCVALAAGSPLCASGGEDGHVCLFDSRAGKMIHSFPTPSEVSALTVTPDETGLLCLNVKHQVWGAERSVRHTVTPVALGEFSLRAVGKQEQQYTLLEAGKRIDSAALPRRGSIRLSGDRSMFSCCCGGSGYVYSIRQPVPTLSMPPGGESSICSMDWHPFNHLLISGHATGATQMHRLKRTIPPAV